MLTDFSLKSFIDSKQQLIEAIEKDPIVIVEYEVQKYGSLLTGVDKTNSQYVKVRPKDILKIHWIFDSDGNTADIQNLYLNGTQYPYNFPTQKILKWIQTNAKIDKNNWFV